MDSIPDSPDVSDIKVQKNREFGNYIEAEKCLIRRGSDRDNTRKAVTESGTTAVVTVLTAGLSAVGAGGLKIMQGMSTVNRMRSAAGALALTAGVNLGLGVKQAVESCHKELEATIKFSGTPEAMSQNICPDYASKLQLAKDAESSCMIDSLLAAADIWPFVKGLNMVGKQFTKDGLLNLYKDPKEREAVEAILKRNGKLTDAERGDAAEIVLGKKLSSTEKDCVLNAHNIGAGKYMKTAESEALGVPLLTSADLLNKKNALQGCGFQVADVSLLMRAGITGAAPEEAKTFIRQASVKLFGKDLNSKQVDAIWDAAGKKRDEQIEFLKSKGFSEAEATKIANRELDKLNKADVKAVILNDQPFVASAASVATPVAKTSAGTQLADAFDTGNTAKLTAAYKASRDEALQIAKNPAELLASPNKILDLSTRGLNAEESAILLNKSLSGDTGFKKSMELIDERIALTAKKYSAQGEFNELKLQELKFKLMEDYYSKKYSNYGSLDRNRFDEVDERAFQAFQNAETKLEQLRKKADKRWP